MIRYDDTNSTFVSVNVNTYHGRVSKMSKINHELFYICQYLDSNSTSAFELDLKHPRAAAYRRGVYYSIV